MKIVTVVAWILLLLFVVGDEACKLLGTHLPRSLGFLFAPLAVYLWIYDWLGWKDLEERNEKPASPKTSQKPKTDPPRGYTGPFWNKPSVQYLKSSAQAESGTLAFYYAFLLVPFGALVYLLLR